MLWQRLQELVTGRCWRAWGRAHCGVLVIAPRELYVQCGRCARRSAGVQIGVEG